MQIRPQIQIEIQIQIQILNYQPLRIDLNFAMRAQKIFENSVRLATGTRNLQHLRLQCQFKSSKFDLRIAKFTRQNFQSIQPLSQ